MCLFYVSVLCLGRGLATSWSLVQGVPPSVKWSWNWKQRPGHKGAVRPVKRKKITCKDKLETGFGVQAPSCLVHTQICLLYVLQNSMHKAVITIQTVYIKLLHHKYLNQFTWTCHHSLEGACGLGQASLVQDLFLDVDQYLEGQTDQIVLLEAHYLWKTYHCCIIAHMVFSFTLMFYYCLYPVWEKWRYSAL
jgi:hypothetical protein